MVLSSLVIETEPIQIVRKDSKSSSIVLRVLTCSSNTTILNKNSKLKAILIDEEGLNELVCMSGVPEYIPRNTESATLLFSSDSPCIQKNQVEFKHLQMVHICNFRSSERKSIDLDSRFYFITCFTKSKYTITIIKLFYFLKSRRGKKKLEKNLKVVEEKFCIYFSVDVHIYGNISKVGTKQEITDIHIFLTASLLQIHNDFPRLV